MAKRPQEFSFAEYLTIGRNITGVRLDADQLQCLMDCGPTTDQQHLNTTTNSKRRQRMPRVRARQAIKPSVIRRLCRPPTRKDKMLNPVAEVVYTNPAFGTEPIPCTGPNCNCFLAPHNCYHRNNDYRSARRSVSMGRQRGAPFKAQSQFRRCGRAQAQAQAARAGPAD
ncbi:hypothetical protein KR093_008764 [Drosophila rubida]|uniref:Uncharacterized protein n=1 Tax=Drosophila rubida TaxID=30044 RepID=A0AAD4K9D4_9MUSC|nr:hypothetical protein KR093_008764 [Drosophila rubida]